jgi:hypothetical protein
VPSESRRGRGLLAALVAVACSSEPASGSAAPSQVAATLSDIHAMCEAECARSARCGASSAAGPDAGAHCVSGCERGWTVDNVKNARADVPRAVAGCAETLPCGTSDDACIGRAVAANLGQTVDASVHAPDIVACLSKQRECAATPAQFSDDLCGSLAMMVEPVRARAEECFTGTCEAVLQCMKPLAFP